MRPYTNFRNKRVGKRIDYDGAFGFQCTDLAKLYCDEVLELGKIGALGNAKDVHKGKMFAHWEKLGMDNLMQGDIIIRTEGKYGHIAIVDRIIGNYVRVLEQNGSGKNSGSGVGDNAIRVKKYKRSWYQVALRCKKIFDNLVLEREFVAKKLERLRKQPQSLSRDSEIRITEEYIASTRYLKA